MSIKTILISKITDKSLYILWFSPIVSIIFVLQMYTFPLYYASSSGGKAAAIQQASKVRPRTKSPSHKMRVHHEESNQQVSQLKIVELMYLYAKQNESYMNRSKQVLCFCWFLFLSFRIKSTIKCIDMHLPYSTVIAVTNYSQGLSQQIELINLHVQKPLPTKKKIFQNKKLHKFKCKMLWTWNSLGLFAFKKWFEYSHLE